MGFFDSIKESIQRSSDRKRAEREALDKLRQEAKMQQQIAFEEEFAKRAKDVAVARAKKDAARLSGYQKMQAENRLRNLNRNDQKPDSWFSKFSEYTQKNMAKRDENLKATEERRANLSQTKKPFR